MNLFIMMIFNCLKQSSKLWLEKSLNPIQKLWFKRYVAITEMQMKVLKGEVIDITKFIKEHPYINPDASKEVKKQMDSNE